MKGGVPGFTSKSRILYLIFVVMAIAIVAKIVYIQLSDTPVSHGNLMIEEIEPKRGTILACNGEPLAVTIPHYEVRFDAMVPQQDTLNKYIDSLSMSLANFFQDTTWQRYKEKLLGARAAQNKYFLVNRRPLNYAEFEKVKTFPLFNKGKFGGGLVKNPVNIRIKPYGNLAGRTIGQINKEGVGVGIEITYNSELKGIPGKRIIQRVSGGRWIPIEYAQSIPPVDGNDIRTTIDIEIQEIAETALKKKLLEGDNFLEGTAVVMEVATGAVKAIVNLKKNSNGTFSEILNLAIGRRSEPGSTFKLATLICLLEDGYVTLDTPVEIGNGTWKYLDKVYKDVSHLPAETDVRHAFKKSSNVAFTKLAAQHYADNPQAFIDRIMGLKITDKLVLDIKAEGTASLIDPKDKSWSPLTLTSIAMGYSVELTPMHTLTFYNAVANGGRMMKPYFIQSFENEDGVIQEFPPQEILGSICSKSTIEQAVDGLCEVIKDNKRIRSEHFTIAGKTGTAKILLENGAYEYSDGRKRHQASFAGFFPAENPKYSAIVVLYSVPIYAGQNLYGGAWAGPVFKDIAEQIYARKCNWIDPLTENGQAIDNPEIYPGNAAECHTAIDSLYMVSKPSLPESGWMVGDTTGIRPLSETQDSIPQVIGMGLKDAIYLLEQNGYSVTFSGAGKVLKQTHSGNRIHLELGIPEKIHDKKRKK